MLHIRPTPSLDPSYVIWRNILRVTGQAGPRVTVHSSAVLTLSDLHSCCDHILMPRLRLGVRALGPVPSASQHVCRLRALYHVTFLPDIRPFCDHLFMLGRGAL